MSIQNQGEIAISYFECSLIFRTLISVVLHLKQTNCCHWKKESREQYSETNIPV